MNDPPLHNTLHTIGINARAAAGQEGPILPQKRELQKLLTKSTIDDTNYLLP